MENIQLKPIGFIQNNETESFIQLDKNYAAGLTHLDGFSHIFILWHFDQSDSAQKNLIEKSPYKNAPEIIGTFATRSPNRPNPIALSCVRVCHIDRQEGIIMIDYIDAEHGSPVIDIKPYIPSLDRVNHPQVPEWCQNWPMSLEDSANFNWESVFNF